MFSKEFSIIIYIDFCPSKKLPPMTKNVYRVKSGILLNMSLFFNKILTFFYDQLSNGRFQNWKRAEARKFVYEYSFLLESKFSELKWTMTHCFINNPLSLAIWKVVEKELLR